MRDSIGRRQGRHADSDGQYLNVSSRGLSFPKRRKSGFKVLATDDCHIGLYICPDKDVGIISFMYRNKGMPFDQVG